MKSIIVLIMVLAASLTFADTVSVKEGETQLNYRTNASYATPPAGYIEAGADFAVVGEVLSWVKVVVEDAKRGKVEGWIGAKILVTKNNVTIIGGQGCTLRTAPKAVKSTEDGYLWPKSVVIKTTDKRINFYKIKVGAAEVYVSARYCTLKAGK